MDRPTPSSPPQWVRGAVFYQIFPDRFARSARTGPMGTFERWEDPPTLFGFKGGNLRGITEKLDYLQDLGVTALYLNPVFKSAANHRYHTYDYFAVDPILGGNEAFEELLAAAHHRSMKVILDGVFNHTGRGFFPFHHILENGPASPYLDWFHIKGFPLRAYSPRRKPNYEAWWGLAALPKLNTDNPRVRAYIMEVAEHWIRRGIDGWRLDVPQEIKTPGFWEEFRSRVKALNPEAYLVGEIWGDASAWLSGGRFDAAMNYVLSRACLGFFGGEDLDTSAKPGGYPLRVLDGPAFGRTLEKLIASHRWETTLAQFNLLDSHDTPRFLTLVGGRKERLKSAVLFLMTFPGVPCVYYGDEVGLEGGNDPDCRRAFPWDEARWDHEIRRWYKDAIALRHRFTSLQCGAFEKAAVGARTYAFLRRSEKEVVVAAFNSAAEVGHLTIEPSVNLPLQPEKWRLLLGEASLRREGEALIIALPPLSACAYEVLP